MIETKSADVEAVSDLQKTKGKSKSKKKKSEKSSSSEGLQIQKEASSSDPPSTGDIEHDYFKSLVMSFTEIGKKAWLFAKLQPGRARKRINAT